MPAQYSTFVITLTNGTVVEFDETTFNSFIAQAKQTLGLTQVTDASGHAVWINAAHILTISQVVK